MGLELRDGKLSIRPSIPGHWSGFSAVYRQPTGSVKISVERREDRQDIPVELVVDGAVQAGLDVSFPVDGGEKEVLVRVA